MTGTINFSRAFMEPVKQLHEDRMDYMSPSGLAVLEQCPRAYAIQRDYQVARQVHPDIEEDVPNYKMKFGSVFHRAIELSLDKEVDTVASEMAGDLPESGWDGFYTGVKDIATGVRQCLKAFWASEHSADWKIPGARKEESIETDIDGMAVRGIVDMINDEGHVKDAKTTTKGRPQWHGSQLGAYWMMAKKEGYDPIDTASIVKVYRPRKPDGASGVDVESIDASKQVPHIRRLAGIARWLRDHKNEWRRNFRKIRSNPSASRCMWCVAKGSSACPESRTW